MERVRPCMESQLHCGLTHFCMHRTFPEGCHILPQRLAQPQSYLCAISFQALPRPQASYDQSRQSKKEVNHPREDVEKHCWIPRPESKRLLESVPDSDFGQAMQSSCASHFLSIRLWSNTGSINPCPQPEVEGSSIKSFLFGE